MGNNTPLVSVLTQTYNQAPYIRECLDGILMQQTNFAYELLIYDDASTDGTADIIREYEARYPDIIKPIYQTENQFSKGVRISLEYQYPRVKGKYVTYCEGDDYWTDPLKLTKQVLFMEENPEIPCCFHTVDQYQENSKKLSKGYIPSFLEESNKTGEFFTNENRIEGWFAYILAIMFRSEYCDYLKKMSEKYVISFNDNHIIYYLMKGSKAYLFKESMAVYRMNDGGIFGNKPILYKLNRSYNITKELYTIEPDKYTESQFLWCTNELFILHIKNRDYLKAFKWKREHYNEIRKGYFYILKKAIKNSFKKKTL